MWPGLTDEATAFGDEVATFADLLLLGAATGLAEDAMALTRQGLAGLEHADLEISDELVHEEAVAFRRARRLESGEDLRAWLAARQLTMGDWEDHLRRSIAARWFSASSIGSGAPLGSGLDRQAFAVDLACGGWWGRLADLAARLWAAARLAGDDVDVADIADVEVRDEATRIIAAFEALADLGETWCIEGLRRIWLRERALEEAQRRCATGEAVSARVLAHANDWTELRYDELLLPTREAANEALLCAREDHVEAPDLASRAGLPLAQRRSRHDSLPAATASLLDGALPDQALGPVPLEGRWAVLWLRERRRPSLDDTATLEAAASELLEEALERVEQGLIRQAKTL